MNRRCAIALAAALGAQPAAAEIVERRGTFGGLDVEYRVVLPDGYDPARAYPGVLVFTGGAHSLRGVEGTLAADWRVQAERRGYIVVSPAGPGGRLFFESGDRIFPEFLDRFLAEYRILGRLHVAGHSNGGLSAFHVATRFPQYFATVIGYPGLIPGQDAARADVLKSLCVFMHVGDQDPAWRTPMQSQAESLRKTGVRIRFQVEPNQGHRLRADTIDLSTRLFEEIESCK
jgi:poly(3-hydroxybutyrate) depolymerase